MAYSDYGAFVRMNGARRTDKEDVGVFDTDESNLPSGARIFANILKNRKRNNDNIWDHSHHGVMGDGNIRVGCYKQGWPTIYHWKDNEKAPTILDSSDIIDMLGWHNKPFVEHYLDKNNKKTYYIDYEYPVTKFQYEGYQFVFISKQDSNHYVARMTEPDGTEWECEYDYGFGAGF